MSDISLEDQPLSSSENRSKKKLKIAIFVVLLVLLLSLCGVLIFLFVKIGGSDEKKKETEVEKVPEVQNVVSPKVETEIVPKVEPGTEPQTDPQPEPELEPEPEPEPEPEVAPEVVPEKKEKKLTDDVVHDEPQVEDLKPKVDEVKDPVEQTLPNNVNYFEQFTELAKKKNVTIVDGDVKAWRSGRFKIPPGKFTFKWKLERVANILKYESNVDLDYELETVLAYDDHGREYGLYYGDENGYENTYGVFRKNKKAVDLHNKNPDRLFNLKLNSFAPYVTGSDEYLNHPIRESKYLLSEGSPSEEDLSDQEIHVDWRTKGILPPVIDQGRCGSCWAVASTDVLSSFYSIKKRKPVRFSYQQVFDCTSEAFTCGSGGSHVTALNYMKNNKMCLEDEKPFTRERGKCKTDHCTTRTEVKQVKVLYSDTALDYLKYHGPFVTTIMVKFKFLFYGDGIFDADCDGGSPHSVLIVGHGYDKKKGVNYWIVKNSWGRTWGDRGYIKVLDGSMHKELNQDYACRLSDRAFTLL